MSADSAASLISEEPAFGPACRRIANAQAALGYPWANCTNCR